MSTLTPIEAELCLDVFGSQVRVLVGVPREVGLPSPEMALAGCEEMLRDRHVVLSRFEEGSELSRLNADRRETVDVSSTLALHLAAAKRAFTQTAGLVDATLLDEVKDNGYVRSLVGSTPPGLREALAEAGPRRRATPKSQAPWDRIFIDRGANRVQRPPGTHFDLGGVAKGVAADECAIHLSGFSSYAVDCGGDLRIGGIDSLEREVFVSGPFDGRPEGSIAVTHGAVATTGLRRRLWRTPGGFAHHLIDPATGHPAWTGLVQATALAPTSEEAEALAKAATLSGPDGAGDWLSRFGGVTFDDAGRVAIHGSPDFARAEA